MRPDISHPFTYKNIMETNISEKRQQLDFESLNLLI